jgi:hypothetical protein
MPDDLILCFDITEKTVQMIYQHEAQAKALKRRIPKKKKAVKKKVVQAGSAQIEKHDK